MDFIQGFAIKERAERESAHGIRSADSHVERAVFQNSVLNLIDISDKSGVTL